MEKVLLLGFTDHHARIVARDGAEAEHGSERTPS